MTAPDTRERRPEKAIEWDVMKALAALGFDVTKTSQPRASMITRGVPDLYARSEKFGIRLWLEVKTERGYLSRHQEVWHANERACGGDVVVVRSVSDVVAALRERGVPIQ